MRCDIDSFLITLGLGEDEVDGTGSAERALSTLLNEMGGIGEKKDVIVMACTKDKSILDDAVLRPGRFVFYNLTLCYHFRSTRQACVYRIAKSRGQVIHHRCFE